MGVNLFFKTLAVALIFTYIILATYSFCIAKYGTDRVYFEYERGSLNEKIFFVCRPIFWCYGAISGRIVFSSGWKNVYPESDVIRNTKVLIIYDPVER